MSQVDSGHAAISSQQANLATLPSYDSRSIVTLASNVDTEEQWHMLIAFCFELAASSHDVVRNELGKAGAWRFTEDADLYEIAVDSVLLNPFIQECFIAELRCTAVDAESN